ncbi:Acetyltransferase involved in cellulose biosynthesis, CelD/BcsL family [Faunimonas pinastri]|uniref:Acetyltransferase involved in cellulose biosynthesis, CelD/BcsL family n=1 Tax=Faunimonas pinastri TaxID=1855383 RepID=A0A1H9FJI5_9HYPH|nr:GNAT family N-acetyltransferase [Faunimonas pinastri]SEQ38057.1 Acetyltransferase involved in cellulose biosynthesis, CelD/BcsL family [Faunimonas pinastri]
MSGADAISLELPGAAFTTELIRDLNGLRALEKDWWALWHASGSATPFQSPAWLIPWWESFHPGALFTLAVRQGGRLVALSPGYLEDGVYGRRILPVGISLSDYHDVLLDPAAGDPALSALSALSDLAAAHSDEWDSWDLEELPEHAAAFRVPIPLGCRDEITPASACPVLEVVEGEDVFAQARKSKKRHLRLARNRAAKRGAVSFETATDETCLDLLGHLFRLHARRWGERGEEGVLAPDVVQQFQRAAVPRLQKAGLLRLDSLRIGGKIVAVQYCLRRGDWAATYINGFDPDYEFESPGMVLMEHVLADLAAGGVRTFSFLRGREAHKYDWGATDRMNRKRTISHAGAA